MSIVEIQNEVQQEPRRSKELFNAVVDKRTHEQFIKLLEHPEWLTKVHATLNLDDRLHKGVLQLCQTVHAQHTQLLAASRAAIVAYHEQYAAAEAAYQHEVAVWEAQNGCTFY